jgi:hypothetical protein
MDPDNDRDRDSDSEGADVVEPRAQEVGRDELRLGDDGRGRSRVNPLVWVVLAVVGLVAGLLVLGHGSPEPSSSEPSSLPSTHQNGPKPSGRPIVRLPTGPNQRQYVGVTSICPAVTDHRKRLAVTFEVSNVSRSDVFITSVRSVLPLRGLRPRGPATAGGSCAQPENLLARGLIAPEQSQFFTLAFTLPKQCPAPYPVQVRVGYKADGFVGTSLSLLLSDLSVLDFDSCPNPKNH